jgi:hypothetical protein
MEVSASPFAAANDDDRIAFANEVLDHEPLLGIDDRRADGDQQRQVAGAAAVAFGTGAWLAVWGAPKLAVGELGEAVHPAACFEDDARTVPAVAPIGAAAWDVFFTAEANATVSPAAGTELDFDAVNKHEWPWFSKKKADL